MLRSVGVTAPRVLAGLALLVCWPAWASIWPDQLGGCLKQASRPLAPADRGLWDEYGLQQAEQAEYVGCASPFQAEAYRLKDATGALAAFEWRRPAEGHPSKLAPLAVETGDGVLLVYNNYLLRFTAWKPGADALRPFFETLRDVNQAPLPELKDYLPSGNLVPNSERYVLGPAGLDKFEPRIPPSVAAFHLSAEAALARYRTKSDPLQLAIFSYPTPQIARQRLAEFEKLPGAMAKRSGPLVAVVVSPSDPDAAERLLSEVRYQANITFNERVPNARDNVGNLILAVFNLIGLLLGACLVIGLTFGFMRRWIHWGRAEEPMILLHLQDRR